MRWRTPHDKLYRSWGGCREMEYQDRKESVSVDDPERLADVGS
jgi:hypothetical protein